MSHSPRTPSILHLSGRHLVAVMFAVAALLGGYAWYTTYQRGQLCLEVWGSRAAVLIRYAPEIQYWELQKLSAELSPDDSVRVNSRELAVSKVVDISDVPGLVHAKHALIEDASFDWLAPRPDQANWHFALHFVDDTDTCTVLFDTSSGLVQLADSNRGAVLKSELARVYAERSRRWSGERE